jgi:hypothetical protein
MKDVLSVSTAARLLGVRPRDISDLFYQRKLSDGLCPLVGGRRLINREHLPLIKAALGAAGGGRPTRTNDRTL